MNICPGRLNVLLHSGMSCLVIPKRCLNVLADERSHDMFGVWGNTVSLIHAYPGTSDTQHIRFKKNKVIAGRL